MTKVNKKAESTKNLNNSNNVEVANQEATAKEAKEVDNTPTLNADPVKIWDLVCNALGADDTTPRGERAKNTIDRQFYGIARATTLALLAGGQDAILERLKALESDTPAKVATLLDKGYNRQAVACYFELCLIRSVQLSINEFEKCYICTEGVKDRGAKLGSKILEKFDTLGVLEEEAGTFVKRFSSEKISDKKLLEYIKEHGVDYDTAVTALSNGGKKMRLDFEELKKLGIYEINFTSNSAVKDYVYFAIK